MYSGGSGLSIDIHFVDIEINYDVLSPLPIVLSKHFNHPHPYIEIATAISDYAHFGHQCTPRQLMLSPGGSSIDMHTVHSYMYVHSCTSESNNMHATNCVVADEHRQASQWSRHVVETEPLVDIIIT